MFNVTILKMKDIMKYTIGIIITLSIVVVISKYFGKETKDEEKVIQEVKNGVNLLSQNSFLKCFDQTLPTISDVNEEYRKVAKEDEEKKEEGILEEMLSTQISAMKGIKNTEEIIENEKANQNENQNEKQNEIEETNSKIEVAQTGVATQVITENPIKESYTTQYGKVKIKNETDYELTNEVLKPDITIENKNILLFHTHSCESYTSSDAHPYTPTGNYRTTDLNFTVTRLGTELENHLKQYNYNVIHSKEYHDYPAYNGSYTRSLETTNNLLKINQSDIIMDIHRDAIGSRSDYAPIVKIGDNEVAAQIMFVIGTNNGGLWHPNWNQNLKFAVKIQEKAEEMYPGLFKPIMLTKSRYNQHTGKYANIIEVGATGNTLEQCITSMKYLAKVMDEIMK